jgi:hypothetical protein
VARATDGCERLGRKRNRRDKRLQIQDGIEPLDSKVAALMPPAAANGLDAADDLAPENLLDTHAASARFGFPRDTIAKSCREGRPQREGRRSLDGERAAAAAAQWA